MKKIGVLTYLKEYSNIGTNMQGYSTLKAIEREYQDDHVELVNYSGWKPAMKPYFTGMTPRSLWYDFRRIKKYNKFFRNDLVLGKRSLISGDTARSLEFIESQDYDAIYVGSDTLLELKRAAPDQLTAYWLSEKISATKVLIAASSHNVYYESLSPKQKDLIGKTVNDFSLMGVRDDATYRLLRNFVSPGDKRLMMVPDPTFTYDIDYSHVEKYLEKKRIDFTKPIVCLHLVRDTSWGFEVAQQLRKDGYQVASMRPCRYADILFTDLSPFEHVGLYKYFSFMVTHRFHDSIFCLKNLTPVVVFSEFESDVTMHGESKNRTLFRSFNIEGNFIANKEKVKAVDILKSYPSFIESFQSVLPGIKQRLIQNKEEYESFVRLSRSIVENPKGQYLKAGSLAV